MNPRVVNVTPGDNYTLSLVFTNGAKAIYDCHDLLYQMTAFDQVPEVYHSKYFG
jgi:hypothetical protein